MQRMNVFGTRVRVSQRKSFVNLLSAAVLGAALMVAVPGWAQTAGLVAGPEAVPAGSSAAAHSVVRWSGVMPGFAGKVVEVRLGIYENQAGGQALWSEMQRVAVGLDGHYSVLLGATTGAGLPEGLFPTGEARWIEARPVGGEGVGARNLITAVPYAFKAADADTLGGRSAAEYVTREQMQAASTVLPAGPVGAGLTGPLIAGTGVTNALAVWTNSTTLGSSVVSESGAKIGIGTTAPATTLDVNGLSTLRGAVNLPVQTLATATAGTNSPVVEWGASSFSSTTHAAIAQNFSLQAVTVGNNTTAPSGKLELLFGSGGVIPVATGLSFAPNGQITFAAGQKFPGTGVGSITGITTTSPLTGSGTSGSVALGLNTAALETTLNGKYAQLATGNYFSSTSGSTFNGPITGNSASTMYAIQGNTSSGIAVQGYATSTNGWGINGYATGLDGIGVYGNAVANADSNGNFPVGVQGHVLQGTAVLGVQDEATPGLASVFGRNSSVSGMYTVYKNQGNISAGVWGDAVNGTNTVPSGVFGTTDNGYGGAFNNNSAIWPAVYGFNASTGGTGLFKVAMLGSPQGTCGVGEGGNLSCTGQVKMLVSAGGGTRTVETYSVQSPENWMEDFGSGSLSGGAVVVTIDAAFAETVSGDASYKVFLTPNGESKGLYVTNKTATSFEVRESGGGTASIGFDYRIVAKRRGFEAQRMVDVTETFNREMLAAKRQGLGIRK